MPTSVTAGVRPSSTLLTLVVPIVELLAGRSDVVWYILLRNFTGGRGEAADGGCTHAHGWVTLVLWARLV